MMEFTTLHQEAIEVDHLANKEKEILRRLSEDYDKKMDWLDFKNKWHEIIRYFYEKLSKEEFVETELYRIYQDLSSRLGIEQKEIRLPDEQ